MSKEQDVTILLRNTLGSPSVIPANRIVEFENSLFVGKACFCIRTRSSLPPVCEHFAKKNRNIEVQLQGRFKSVPKGRLYLGAELTKLSTMKLGMILKGIGTILLGTIRRLSHGEVHYDWGDPSVGTRPHLVSTLWNMVDNFIVTEPGDEPPPLGTEINEDNTERKRRKRLRPEKYPALRTDATYTFTFQSMYIDVQKWSAVNFPGLKRVDLHRFWKDSPLNFVLYAVEEGDHSLSSRTDILGFEISPP